MKLTDEQLRQDPDAGRRVPEIAERHGITPRAVFKRVARLGLSTTASLHAPEESKRFTRATLGVMEQLRICSERANKMLDAADRWLTDPGNPDCYDIGPRVYEVEVTYEVQVEAGEDRYGNPRFKIERRKAKLSDLLTLVQDPHGDPIVTRGSTEAKISDPRDLLLKTCAELRLLVNQVAQLHQMLADGQRITDFQEALLEEITKAAPEVAGRIAEAVQRALILRGCLDELLTRPELAPAQ